VVGVNGAVSVTGLLLTRDWGLRFGTGSTGARRVMEQVAGPERRRCRYAERELEGAALGVTARPGSGTSVAWELELWLEGSLPKPRTAPTLLLPVGRHNDDAN
jgi:hypothetical protein